jgi:hypothetical protein
VESALHDPVRRQTRSLPSNRGRATPHHLVVLGVDAPNIVTAAGGLICDSVRAGLRVDVYLERGGDERALHILGVSARALPDHFEFEAEWPDAILLGAELQERHTGVRRLVADATRRRRAQVAAWGDCESSDMPTGIDHRLSVAAQAFKRHAMKAAGMAGQVSPTESFSGRLHRPAHGPSLLPLR